jgi:hypothetical protein
MIKHIVLFRLTSFSNTEEKEAQLKQMDDIYSVLPYQLPFIIDFRTGRNITAAGHAWDFAMIRSSNLRGICLSTRIVLSISKP